MSLFKSAIFYRLDSGWVSPEMSALEEALSADSFQPCGPTQEVSAGWVPPRNEEHAALVENIGGQLILKLMVERKVVPGSALNAALEEKVKELEASTGRKPGRKECRELKDELRLTLLPRAFSKKTSHLVWLDPVNRTVVVGAGSSKGSDLVLTTLVAIFSKLDAATAFVLLAPKTSPAVAMSHWLINQEAPSEFSLDRELELKSAAEDKACVKYAKHHLDLVEIAEHIHQGKLPTYLAMTWQSKVSFILTSSLRLRKLTLLDLATEVSGEESSFDGDVALETGTLQKLLPALLDALGGEELPTPDSQGA